MKGWGLAPHWTRDLKERELSFLVYVTREIVTLLARIRNVNSGIIQCIECEMQIEYSFSSTDIEVGESLG